MTERPIRAIVVDDEALARRGIQLRLASHPDIEIVGACANGREALDAIAASHPDLMFLDVQMPGLSGFDVLARLPRESMPMTIFTTAYDRYAIDAFEAQAIDYLLKPIDEQRFAQALERARTYRNQRTAVAQREKLMRLLTSTRNGAALDERAILQQLEGGERSYPSVLPIREESGTLRLEINEIDWIDAAGDYMCVHAGGRTHVLRETMKALDAILDPSLFQRVHRSTIVNVRRVRRLRPHTNGEYYLTLNDGQELKLSRSYRDRIERFLSRN